MIQEKSNVQIKLNPELSVNGQSLEIPQKKMLNVARNLLGMTSPSVIGRQIAKKQFLTGWMNLV